MSQGRSVSCGSARSLVISAAWWLVTLLLAGAGPVHATPSFARQTGQPCAACHTVPPELSPLGRRFMLGGFTMTGGEGGLPISGYLETGATRIARDSPDLGPHLRRNNNLLVQRAKLIGAGALTDHAGAYAELVYSPQVERLQLGQVDLRWSDSAAPMGHDLVYGVSLGNTPGFQDPWNSAPARSWPYARSTAAPSPKVVPLLEGPLARRVAGASVYGFLNDGWYAELGLYGGITRSTQDRLGLDADAQRRVLGTASYGRMAFEAKVPSGTLSLGGHALTANLDRGAGPDNAVRDRVRSLGVDLLWQWSGGPDEVTVRSSFSREDWRTGRALATDPAAPGMNRLDSLKASVTYLRTKDKAVTAGVFRRTGSSDSSFWHTAGGKPDTAGVMLDAFAINPFFPPPSWHPGMRTRVGATLTHHPAFDGVGNHVDGGGLKARDHDTLFVYFLLAL